MASTPAGPLLAGGAMTTVQGETGDEITGSTWHDRGVGRSGGVENGATVQFVEVRDGHGACGVDFSFQVPRPHVESYRRVYIPVAQYGASDGDYGNEPASGVIRWDAETRTPRHRCPRPASSPSTRSGPPTLKAPRSAPPFTGAGGLMLLAVIAAPLVVKAVPW